ncbi:hypothetical protein Chor_000241, partial [Crotalus horridus]
VGARRPRLGRAAAALPERQTRWRRSEFESGSLRTLHAMADDAELERKAVEELLTEAKRGKTRAETMGPMGWMKCPLASTNKRFLINTIKNTLHSPKEQDQGEKDQEENKDSEPSQSREETKPKRHRVHPYKPSFRSRRRVSCSPPRHRHRPRNQNTKDKYEKRSSK